MEDSKKTLPLLTLRDVIIFPGTTAPIFIGRDQSIEALQNTKQYGDGQHILITTQKKKDTEKPGSLDLYHVGVLTKIIQIIKLPNNNAKILVEALHRVKLSNIQTEGKLLADYAIEADNEINNLSSVNNSCAETVGIFKEYAKSDPKINMDMLGALLEQKNPSFVTNLIASHLSSDISVKQEILEEKDILKRTQKLFKIITAENVQIDTEKSVQERVKKQIEKTQKDFYLNEQMKALQKEIDGNDGAPSETAELQKKINKTKLSKEAKEKVDAEMKKLKMMNPMSAEASVVRNFLDVILAMPWGKRTKSEVNLAKTEEILDRDHYGLEKVKERVVEYLSVLKRSDKIKGPIICLVGPPGVGKTSLVKSIAEAMGRKYSKFALGGVRDESEIRGHRRTYLGSMPGKIINSIKKAKVDNPVVLLDEIDKMSSDYRGDPTSALLEVLDPEQNCRFVDHYLEVEYDLSDVIFIATANSYNLPRPLLDRMEIIDISGYIEEEKMSIAKNHLVKKQFESHKLEDKELKITDDAMLDIIRYYTKESGVRSLERMIGKIVRKVLTKILKEEKTNSITIKPKDLEEYLGVRKYRFGLAETEDQIGATTGLAYTEVGGELLTIEAVKFPGKGEIKSTGKIGDVMKESTQAAYSCLLNRAKELGLAEKDYQKTDIHIHFPEGATPKDGPSAGIAIYTTLVSLLTSRPVNKTVAMTGEVTLRGLVLPIGGLKEKLLAAKRGGIKKVLIPKDNEKDLKDIPEDIKKQLKIIAVENIEQVLKQALI